MADMTRFDQLLQTTGTLISWIGQTADGRLSPDDCAKLIAMLPQASAETMLDEAMDLHVAISEGGLTGPLAQQRHALIKRWRQLRKDEGEDRP